MGCGRSTLGSDSPKKRKKKEADGECESDSDSGSNSSSRKQQHGQQHQQQLINKFVPFGAGGPLLAQAKISDSQQDFFMMLDEKIENGPDYDSETEEVDRRRRLQDYAEQWMVLTQGRILSPNNTTMLRVAPVKTGSSFPGDDASGSGDLTEEDEEEDGLSEPERIPDEAVREQYMFMGNLYTLTHIRTDSDKTEPVVDVVAAEPSGEETQVEHIELDHKLNGSAVPEEPENPPKEEPGEETDGKAPSSRPVSRPTSRPASLILRSVFPSDVAQE
ncbi:uncharacterized protein LOC119595823 isoform X2 [Penaeus monodon]|uniref:uncharacterized protein LOC119595823 isoform X2 n=1 Tax=Penaeus monodon TaxID=6687 RepID=UPI0018A79A11|nr:uncharacterized protein LOC119595823 isoform X2 [Penaeus monodon]XP_037800933.1 uncharacterized protein LOC119595823 isoform X2 [Penaeus monodon]